jgi:hypothetical protein
MTEQTPIQETPPRQKVEMAMRELGYTDDGPWNDVAVRDFIKAHYSTDVTLLEVRRHVAALRGVPAPPTSMPQAATMGADGRMTMHCRRVEGDLEQINDDCPGRWGVVELEACSEALLAFGGDVDELIACVRAVRRIRKNWGL